MTADLTTALHRFGLERDRLRSALARRLGITVSDLDALEHLESGPLSHRDLADRLLLTSGAVTLLVDRLERAGLVVRRRHEADRRVWTVELAPDAALPRVPELAAYHAALRAAAAALPAPTRGRLRQFLDAASDSAAQATSALRTTG